MLTKIYMKVKKTALILLSILFSAAAYCGAQAKPTYTELTSEAVQLLMAGDLTGALGKYSEAFNLYGDKSKAADRYNVACILSLTGEPDSSFEQLYYLADKMNYTNLEHLLADNDLESLRSDGRWQPLIDKIASNKAVAEANMDLELAAILEGVFEEDQQYRRQIAGIAQRYGADSPEMVAHWKLINSKDSANLVVVTTILDERGWLGADIVGGKGNSTLFLVIQHADIATQEKYLPMMREAVANNNARPADLALLEDRVALRRGTKQIYGSQVTEITSTGEKYVMPLADPDNVDKRRNDVGLSPLKDYLALMGMTWDVEEYKKNLPRYMQAHGIKE